MVLKVGGITPFHVSVIEANELAGDEQHLAEIVYHFDANSRVETFLVRVRGLRWPVHAVSHFQPAVVRPWLLIFNYFLLCSIIFWKNTYCKICALGIKVCRKWSQKVIGNWNWFLSQEVACSGNAEFQRFSVTPISRIKTGCQILILETHWLYVGSNTVYMFDYLDDDSNPDSDFSQLAQQSPVSCRVLNHHTFHHHPNNKKSNTV